MGCADTLAGWSTRLGQRTGETSSSDFSIFRDPATNPSPDLHGGSSLLVSGREEKRIQVGRRCGSWRGARITRNYPPQRGLVSTVSTRLEECGWENAMECRCTPRECSCQQFSPCSGDPSEGADTVGVWEPGSLSDVKSFGELRLQALRLPRHSTS